MFLHRYGDRNAHTIVLLHGIPGSAASWQRVTDSLSPACDVVVPDLLGLDQGPPPGDLRAEAQAAALVAALDKAGIARATIVGHDFGGPISLSLYRQRPELFAAIALIATNASPDTPIPFPLSLVNLPVVGNAMARLILSAPSLKMMLRMYGGGQLGEATAVRKTFTTTLQNLDELYRDYPAILATVDVPAVVIWGEKDPFFAVERGQKIASLLPDAEFRTLAGAGHFLPEQRPAEVADALLALVARTTEDHR